GDVLEQDALLGEVRYVADQGGEFEHAWALPSIERQRAHLQMWLLAPGQREVSRWLMPAPFEMAAPAAGIQPVAQPRVETRIRGAGVIGRSQHGTAARDNTCCQGDQPLIVAFDRKRPSPR